MDLLKTLVLQQQVLTTMTVVLDIKHHRLVLLVLNYSISGKGTGGIVTLVLDSDGRNF